MSPTRRLWVGGLVGLLAGAMLAVPGTDQRAGAVPAPPATIGRIMIPAAAFGPVRDGYDYDIANYGSYLESQGSASFVAPVYFPVPVVNVERVTLYARAYGRDDEVCAFTFRDSPTTGRAAWAASVCARGASSGLQTVSTTDIDPGRVNGGLHGLHLWVVMTDGAELYGVKVSYSY